MSGIRIFFSANRDRPVYYLHNNLYYDSRGNAVTTPLTFSDFGVEYVPFQPDLTGYDSMDVSQVQYAPVVASTPSGTVLYVDNNQKLSQLPNTSYQNFTNWWVKVPTPRISGDRLSFQDRPVNPQLPIQNAGLNPYPNILLKMIGGLIVFYDAGTPIDADANGDLLYRGRLLVLNNKPFNARTFQEEFPGTGTRYIYIDDLKQKAVLANGGFHVFGIQFGLDRAVLVPSMMDPRQNALARFTGAPSIPPPANPDLTYYQQLQAQILIPLLQQGVQTGVGYDNYVRALDLLKKIQDEQAELARLSARYTELGAQLQRDIEEYNRLRA